MVLLIVSNLLLSIFNIISQEGLNKSKYTALNYLIVFVFALLRISGIDNFAHNNHFKNSIDKYDKVRNYTASLGYLNSILAYQSFDYTY